METALVYIVFIAVFVEVKCKGEYEFVDDTWTPLVERFEEIMKGIEENNGKKSLLEKVLIESIGSVVSKDCKDGLIKDIDGPYRTDVPEVFTKLYVLKHPRDQIEEQLYWILPSVECISKIQEISTAKQPLRSSLSVLPVPSQPNANQSPTSNSKSQVKPGPPSGTSPPPPPSKPEYMIVENPGGSKVLGVVASPFEPSTPKAKQPEKSASEKSNPTTLPSHSSQRPQEQGVQGLGMQQSPPQEQRIIDNSYSSPVKHPYYLPDGNGCSALNKGNNREPNYPTIPSANSGERIQRLREEKEDRQRTLSETRDVNRNRPLDSRTDSAARGKCTSAKSGFQEVLYPERALLPVRTSKHATLRSRLPGRGS